MGQSATSGIEEMEELFEGAGLVAPPIPSALRPALRQQGPWTFASREVDPMAMYRFIDPVAEALVGPVDDYVAVCHSGHGVNSYAITYALVLGPLALFAQAPWGGVYEDRDESADAVRRMLTRCAELIEKLERHPPADSSGARMIVAESDFRGVSIAQRLDRPVNSLDAAAAWMRAAKPHDNAIAAAMRSVREHL